jgi:hypothetical protein
MFRESLFWMPSLGWLAATLDDSLEPEPTTRDLDWALAALHAHDGSVTDLSALLSIPLERSAARRMPRWIFPLGHGRILCAYPALHAPVLFRLLELATGREVQRFDGAALYAEIAGTDPITDAAARAAADWKAGKVFDRDLFATLKLNPMAASEDRILLDTGVGRALLAWSGEGFRLLRVWHSMFGAPPAAARTADGFVFVCGGERDEPDIVRHVACEDGADLGAWSTSPANHVYGIVGEQPPGKAVAITHSDGPVLIWRTSHALPYEVDDMSTVVEERVSAAVGEGGALLAIRFGDDSNELLLHKSGAGDAWIGLRLHALEGSDSIFWLPQPGFSLGPKELAMLCQGELVRVPYDGLRWGSS